MTSTEEPRETRPGSTPSLHRRRSGNLFLDRPSLERGERFEELLRGSGVRIVRILSSDAPDPTLYDQPDDEWVCLLEGEAELWIDGETRTLRAGDFLLLPAHTPHRVLRTSASPRCLWLAVHIERPADDGSAGCDPSS